MKLLLEFNTRYGIVQGMINDQLGGSLNDFVHAFEIVEYQLKTTFPEAEFVNYEIIN